MAFKLVMLVAMCLSLSLAQPSCPCPQLDEPVCGSEGTTYENMCELNCAISQDPDLTLVGDGPCEEESGEESGNSECDCPRRSNPVCGSDGITYDNNCELECAMDEDPSLVLVSKGPCDESDAASREGDQLCDCSLVTASTDGIDVNDLLTCCAGADLRDPERIA